MPAPPTIFFESINDPVDKKIYSPTSGLISEEDFNGVDGDQADFFYPFSVGSRDSSVTAETLYDFDPGELTGNKGPGKQFTPSPSSRGGRSSGGTF